MEIEKRKDIFRLAAVLYADNNYEVSPEAIHKKIVESIFLDNNNCDLTIENIIDLIEDNYTLVFAQHEVESIVTNIKGNHFQTSKNREGETIVRLSKQRLNLLSSKISRNNIDYFISEFQSLHQEYKIGHLKSIIYKFLYEVFSTNISSFSKLLNANNTIEDLKSISNCSFNILEIDIINEFLQWENDEKNKAIFDISSYALEYCLITNKNSSSTFQLNNLRNKYFYLDTNIIFRAIGINGESRKKRTLTFLKKFNEAGETLLLSKFSEEELKSTIKYYIADIGKKTSIRINSKVFLKYRASSDFLNFYHQWSANRSNNNLDLFESYVFGQIESIKKTFNVLNDYKIPFDEKDEEVVKDIETLSSQIHSFKAAEKNTRARFDTSVCDAKNIFLIGKRRDSNSKSIFDTKYFFISSDQALRRWDYSNNKEVPKVILPSQWLSILLRYVNRTNDDFKSFVSFLNLSQNEPNISNEKLHLILTGISEITQDFEIQSAIVTLMIEKKFNGILDNDLTSEQIIEKSKMFTKSKLEEDLEEIKRANEKIKGEFNAHKTTTEKSIDYLKKSWNLEEKKSKHKESENIVLKNELITTKANIEFSKWTKKAYLVFPLLILLFIPYLFLFIYTDRSWNLMSKLGIWINSLSPDSIEKLVAHTIYLAPLGVIIPLIKFINNRLFHNVKRNHKREEIKKSITI